MDSLCGKNVTFTQEKSKKHYNSVSLFKVYKLSCVASCFAAYVIHGSLQKHGRLKNC